MLTTNYGVSWRITVDADGKSLMHAQLLKSRNQDLVGTLQDFTKIEPARLTNSSVLSFLVRTLVAFHPRPDIAIELQKPHPQLQPAPEKQVNLEREQKLLTANLNRNGPRPATI